jgi:hypothetical protein
LEPATDAAADTEAADADGGAAADVGGEVESLQPITARVANTLTDAVNINLDHQDFIGLAPGKIKIGATSRAAPA